MAKKSGSKKPTSEKKKKFKLGTIKKMELPSDSDDSVRKVYAYTNSCSGSCCSAPYTQFITHCC